MSQHQPTPKKPAWMGGLKIGAPIVLLVFVGFGIAWYFVEPAPPTTVVMATGGTEGAYYAFAEKYKALLAENGITLEVRSTAGSVENLKLLADPTSDVSIAFVQGGVAGPQYNEELMSLGSLYLEPLWVFYRGDVDLDRLDQLQGYKLAIGPDGSGTRAIAWALLNENNMAHEKPTPEQTQTVPLSGREAVDALKSGEVDAAFFVMSPQSKLVKELLMSDNIRLMSFRRHQAYASRYRYLSSVTLSEGMIDLPRNIPPRDTYLLAPTATLVAKDDFHSALIALFLKVATEVHRDGGLLETPGKFPSTAHVDLPLSSMAREYIERGPSFLQRFLPFWAASFVDRMKIMLLPLLTLLLPLTKAAPPLYRWGIRSKIYKWYKVLRDMDLKIKSDEPLEKILEDIKKLQDLEQEVAEISVPLSYMDEVYHLRVHVAYLLAKVQDIAKAHQLDLPADQRIDNPSRRTMPYLSSTMPNMKTGS